jgi:GNAT superfamily N-acetyltransferase
MGSGQAVSPLAERWRNAIDASGGRLDLTEGLAVLPELAAAVELPGFDLAIEDGSFAAAGSGGIAMEVMLRWTHPGREDLGTFGLQVDNAGDYASLEDLHLARRVQGSGVGRFIVREVAALCGDLGLSALRTYAFEVGRYAWARCGFDFMEAEDRKRVVEAAARFSRQLGRSPDLTAVSSSWDLAAFPGSEVSADDFARAQGTITETQGLPPLKLGQALLLGPAGNEWAGELDLRPGSPGLRLLNA